MITQEYEYDPIGNRLNYWEGDPLSVTPTTYTPNSLNQYADYTPEGPALTEPVYDDDGNLQEDANWTYTWNTENRLTQITSQDNSTQLRFIYDGLGRRIQKEVYAGDGSGAQSSWTLLELNQFIYDGWNMIAQLDTPNPSAPTVHSTYTWGLDLSGSPQGAGGVGGLLSVVDKTGSTHLPTYDSNGNVMGYFQTDTETLVAEFEYGPFGEITRSTGSKKDDFNFRFSTKYEDAETGFLYYGFRYYDPVTGRWLNRDPIEEAGGLNLYGMLDNDAVNSVDILGLICKDKCSRVGEVKNAKVVSIQRSPAGQAPGRNAARMESMMNSINTVSTVQTLGGAASSAAKSVATTPFNIKTSTADTAMGGAARSLGDASFDSRTNPGMAGGAAGFGVPLFEQMAMQFGMRVTADFEYEVCEEVKCCLFLKRKEYVKKTHSAFDEYDFEELSSSGLGRRINRFVSRELSLIVSGGLQ